MKKGLSQSVLTITAFAVVTRLLGFLLRVYLAYRLGSLLLGVYQVAFSIFGVLMGVVASGVPLTVSALTAKHDARAGSAAATSGLLASALITAVTVALVLVCKRPLLAVLQDEASYGVLLSLLPALAFSGLSASFRGSVWGRKQYGAVSVAELFEQIVRIVACVLLLEYVPHTSLDGAQLAGIAMSVGCGVSAIILTALYFRDGYRVRAPRLLKPVLSSALPITVVRVASSAVGLIIAVLLPLRLVAGGLSSEQALSVYGESVGMALGFLFIPLTLTGSLSMALVPELSNRLVHSDCAHVRSLCAGGLRFAITAAGFFVPVFLVFGKEIGLVFFGSTQAGSFLVKACLVPLPLAMEQIASSMMNSLGLEKKAFLNFCVGTAVLLGVLWFATPALGVDSLSLAMFCSYVASLALHVIVLRERLSLPLGFFRTLAKVLACGVVAALLGYLVASVSASLPAWVRLVLGSVLQCAFVYGGYLVSGAVKGSSLVRLRHRNASKTKMRPTSKMC